MREDRHVVRQRCKQKKRGGAGGGAGGGGGDISIDKYW